jgi:hypothetical protein
VRNLPKLAFFCVLLFSVTIAAYAQEADQDFKKELDEETPQQQKQEAEKPDSKASAGDLAKATQNPVASIRATTNNSLVIKLTNNFHFTLSFWDNYDSRPPTTAKKNELGLSSAIGWAF